MLTFNTTITVYNSQYNEATGFDDYFRTVIHNCSWYSHIKAAANATGMVYDRLFKIRILSSVSASDKQYTAPEEYTDPAAQYTLAVGSIILKGEGPPAPTGAKEYAALTAEHDEAFKVLDYHNNRRVGLYHVYAEGK